MKETLNENKYKKEIHNKINVKKKKTTHKIKNKN